MRTRLVLARAESRRASRLPPGACLRPSGDTAVFCLNLTMIDSGFSVGWLLERASVRHLRRDRPPDAERARRPQERTHTVRVGPGEIDRIRGKSAGSRRDYWEVILNRNRDRV